jgi:spore germination protein GerM
MRRVIAALSLLCLCACTRESVQAIAPEDLPPEIYGQDAGGRAARDAALVVYLVEGNRLVRVGRTGRAPGSEEEVAVRELLAGPTAEEIASGILTRIPETVELLGIGVDGEVASVNLDRNFLVLENSTDPYEFILRTAQIVWTLDELPGVNAVRFLIDGQQIPVLDQNREEVRGPVARARYRLFEPKSDKPVSNAPLQIDI